MVYLLDVAIALHSWGRYNHLQVQIRDGYPPSCHLRYPLYRYLFRYLYRRPLAVPCRLLLA
jgi:hypothetical protein